MSYSTVYIRHMCPSPHFYFHMFSLILMLKYPHPGAIFSHFFIFLVCLKVSRVLVRLFASFCLFFIVFLQLGIRCIIGQRSFWLFRISKVSCYFLAIFLTDLDKNNIVCIEEGAFQDLKEQFRIRYQF